MPFSYEILVSCNTDMRPKHMTERVAITEEFIRPGMLQVNSKNAHRLGKGFKSP